MIQKIITYIIFIISFLGIMLSLGLIFTGLQPCSGDGYMIHLLLLIGVPILVISVVILYLVYKEIKEKYNPFL
jgi:uncharacterized sodium:solute symporter family permease YidK